MNSGTGGTFVLSWHQTELDGIAAAPLELLVVGASWRWASGTAIRLDGPQGPLLLSGDAQSAELRRRAARTVRRLMGAAATGRVLPAAADAGPELPERGFVLTDGRQSFPVTLIELAEAGRRLLMFLDAMPEPGAELWVVRTALAGAAPAGSQPATGGMICFTPGTRLATPDGPRRIESLRQGDRVLTKDDGPQPVLWTGSRRMTGARLFAMPHLRPVRLRAGALGLDRPDADLLVSPQHRLLVGGRAPAALFNAAEVLVAAIDLVDDRTIAVDTALREVTYVHVLMARHQIVWANGLETESFHPSNTSLDTVNPVQRDELLSLFPGLDRDPLAYGDFARRNLTPSEAAILRHDTAA